MMSNLPDVMAVPLELPTEVHKTADGRAAESYGIIWKAIKGALTEIVKGNQIAKLQLYVYDEQIKIFLDILEKAEKAEDIKAKLEIIQQYVKNLDSQAGNLQQRVYEIENSCEQRVGKLYLLGLVGFVTDDKALVVKKYNELINEYETTLLEFLAAAAQLDKIKEDYEREFDIVLTELSKRYKELESEERDQKFLKIISRAFDNAKHTQADYFPKIKKRINDIRERVRKLLNNMPRPR